MTKHGGNIYGLAAQLDTDPEDILDFSANINPLGPPEWLRAEISRAIGLISHYPDPDCSKLAAAIADYHNVTRRQIVVGNGSTELLHLLPQVLNASRIVIPAPSYAGYGESAGKRPIVEPRLSENENFALNLEVIEETVRPDDLVYLGRPNNPTGDLPNAQELRNFAFEHPDNSFVIDESFLGFVPNAESLAVGMPSNMAVLRSMTKFYAIPGLRLGYAVADSETAAALRERRLEWSVNTLAQKVGVAALRDGDYARRSRGKVVELRARLERALSGINGLKTYPSTANFILVRIEANDWDARKLERKLLENGIAIRVCDNFTGLGSPFFRVAVRPHHENQRLMESLTSIFGGPGNQYAKKPGTPAVMLQGTSSNAGKSVLTAALCRILLQDGVRVVPFKSQNMSLNSFVTRDGDEMGRAQVVQAQACRLDPDVRMNPILLKPNTDVGCQVIMRGQPVGNMRVGKYVNYKKEAFDAAKQCYNSLAQEYDAVVLEGAGSPGEVNLKDHDIVNMRMAHYAGAPVLLAGDIDRGGVYASFVGTMEVLAEWERALVTGFIVNRFRGDASLLGAAHSYVLRHTGRKVLGVVPYLENLNLPEEDSVEFKNNRNAPAAADRQVGVVIAVVDLPHISNFTDFDAFRIEPDVSLTIARTPRDLQGADAVIIPGSKSVIADLYRLRESGMADQIVKMAAGAQAEVVGLCAGFQMLGKDIIDPNRLESDTERCTGLGLLPLHTQLASQKKLKLVTAHHKPSGMNVKGYEIHHGRTDAGEDMSLFNPVADNHGERTSLGAASSDGRIWGTYIHGTFDSDRFRRWFIDRLRRRRGMEPLGGVTAVYDIEPALDRLADIVRDSVDMDHIYHVMGL